MAPVLHVSIPFPFPFSSNVCPTQIEDGFGTSMFELGCGSGEIVKVSDAVPHVPVTVAMYVPVLVTVIDVPVWPVFHVTLPEEVETVTGRLILPWHMAMSFWLMEMDACVDAVTVTDACVFPQELVPVTAYVPGELTVY